jgi:threonine aldolase
MKPIDLRSDTVTKPTPEKRNAMAKAEVGDDVFSEDPTVNRLQEMAAASMGKEAGLFVSSGTMGNLIAGWQLASAATRSSWVIWGILSSLRWAGFQRWAEYSRTRLRNQADGSIRMEDIESAIRPDDIPHPISRMLILENTHNRCGGVVLTEAYTKSAANTCRKHNLFFHLDGARVFNAAAALGVDAGILTAPADSVTFCLSKGLCAPVGSVLCGSTEFIKRARRVRKMLGGGMRQAGVLAAAGIISLEKMTLRLSEDHRRAKQLAQGLSEIPGICFDLGMPQTNMVFLSINENVSLSVEQILRELADRGIKVGKTGERRFRLVTHYWIDDEDVTSVIDAFREILAEK